jgi:predicted DNA-binding transcriptional regulator YafY
MAINKLALIRYKTIDECLRNKQKKWTLDAIIQRVSDVLYEKEGIENGVSKRTIQADIQLMRSDKLGYNAPIIVKDKKYYAYEDPSYSITKAPINHGDIDKMKEIVTVLKQLNGFSYFDEMSEMIARLETNIYKSDKKHKNTIQFESNRNVRGLQHLEALHQAVIHEQSLLLEYKSFKAQKSQHLICYPYLLKEFRNRWFLICRQKKNPSLMNLALDRIIEFQTLPNEPFQAHEGVPFERYFSDLIGVTKSEKDRANKVILLVDKMNAPYVITKPLHHSQQIMKEDEKGLIIRIDVVLNFELEREILGFGENIRVLSPKKFAERIERRAHKMVDLYQKSTP